MILLWSISGSVLNGSVDGDTNDSDLLEFNMCYHHLSCKNKNLPCSKETSSERGETIDAVKVKLNFNI